MYDAEMIRVAEILLRLAELLLRRNTRSGWGAALLALAGNDTLSPQRHQVRQLFCGMGSLNDIVLNFADGSINRNGSDEFDRLRSELFRLVRHPS